MARAAMGSLRTLLPARHHRLILSLEDTGMAIPIRLTVGDILLEGELFDTPCGRGIADLLPLEAFHNTWGDEFYFEISLEHDLDPTATSDLEVGDIGYWPPGRALAIFFGPTPMSTGPKPMPASAVNLVGHIPRDARLLKTAKGATRIRIESL
jgi:hypothetical protein